MTNGHTRAIQTEVFAELLRARSNFKPFNSAHEGFAVLKEEVDELWDAIKLKQLHPGRRDMMRREAIQVAAMAIRLVEDVCDKEN